MTDIDTLMSLDPLDMTTTDIDQIIKYQRQQRARVESGVKGARPKKEKGPAPNIDLKALILGGTTPVQVTTGIKRRI